MADKVTLDFTATIPGNWQGNVQLTSTGLRVVSTDIQSLKELFKETNTIRLPKLLHEDILRILATRLENGNWVCREYEGVGNDLVLDDDGALNLLEFVANTPEFLALIEDVTEMRPIVHFSGRIYRMLPSAGHLDQWHNDWLDGRLVGMSISLSPAAYAGGMFQLREEGFQDRPRELPNVVQGDAILFRISPRLSHRVTDVEGSVPKTAFAGWFYSGGTRFHARIRDSRSL